MNFYKQEIPRALSSLKYFCEDAPEYYVAASGSLLGIALHPDTSFPVGKVERLKTFRDNYSPQLSIRFSLKPLEYNHGLLNLPIYLAGMMKPYIAKYLEP